MYKLLQPKTKTASVVVVTSSRIRRRDVLPLREAIPFWFAMCSPLIGLIMGILGAWIVLTR
jgi:hypothetical protein